MPGFSITRSLTDQIYPGNIPAEPEEIAMNPASEAAYIAFEGDRRIGSGDLREVARAARQALGRHPDASILIFNGQTSAPVEVDFRGSVDDVLARLPHRRSRRPRTKRPPSQHRAAPAGRNSAWSRARSRCCRDIGTGWRSKTAAPRSPSASWSTRRGATATMATASVSRRKPPIVSCLSMAGNRPHYEEAIRALFADDAPRFGNIDRRMARGRARPCGPACRSQPFRSEN